VSRSLDPRPTPPGGPAWEPSSGACPPPSAVAARVDGELDAAAARAVDEHLDRCASCAAEAHRVEGLSGLLRAWDAKRGGVEPPARFHEGVLKAVRADAIARRRSVLAAVRRPWLAAAACLLAVGVAGGLGARSALVPSPPATTSADASGGLDALLAVAAAPRGSVGAGVSAPKPIGVLVKEAGGPGLESAASRFAEAGTPPDLSVLADPEAARAFAVFEALRAVEERLGEEVVVLAPDHVLVGKSAAEAYESAQRRNAWIQRRLRRATEPPTHDPASPGLPLARWMALPVSGDLAAFLRDLPRREEPSSAATGGVVLRALPVPAGDPEPVDGAIDLAEAVRRGSVRLLEAATPSAETVVAQVRGLEAPVLVPAGELLRGGLCARVVARGQWLSPGPDAYLVRLACRSVGPVARSPRGMPAPIGAVAGPDLRGALVSEIDGRGIRALVRAQVRGAALDEAGEEPDLLALYEDADGARVRRARALVADLFASGSRVRGLLATDPDGRFQGLESVALSGPAGTALLERLVFGYLAEAASRSKADGPRLGVHAEMVLSVLADRPVRLMPPGPAAPSGRPAAGAVVGDEPRTGVVLEAVATDDGDVGIASALLPDVR
jgi:hypothetical protein